jgi:hypothetical protein
MLQQKQTLGFQSLSQEPSEQFTLFILEGVFDPMAEIKLTKEDLWPKHANLE